MLLPLSVAIGAIVAHSDRIIALVVAAPNFHLPAAPAWLADIPLVGDAGRRRWRSVSADDAAEIVRLARPYVGTITQWFVGAAGSVGGMFVHLLLTIALAAVLYASGETAASWCRRFGRRLAGARGEEVAVLAGQAIRSVALGVVVTAIAQSLVAGVGLALAGVPHAGILTAIDPDAVHRPARPGSGAGARRHLAVRDGRHGARHRPRRLHRDGADHGQLPAPVPDQARRRPPLLLILVGVIGGLLAFGLLGLFLGPVVLAITYTLLQNWIADADA